MKAFVKTTKGTFPNLNFYLAWEAFNTLGYSVTCFEEEEIETLDITPATPVFTGVKIFRQIIDKLGVDYPPFDCYPEVLKPYYGRNLRRSTLGVERAKFHKDGIPVFVKPVLPKQFLGHVWNSLINLIPITNVPDDSEVWVCEPVDILSEFRVYVQDGEILGVKHYFGEWDSIPSEEFIKAAIRAYKNAPVAYGIDIAVTKNPDKDIVLEVNDGCNLGNYGLDSIHYGEMIIARWFEIMANSNVKKYIANELEQARQTDEFLKDVEGRESTEEFYKKLYFKPYDENSRPYKDILVSDQTKRLREKSMEAFAKEVQKNLREEGNV